MYVCFAGEAHHHGFSSWFPEGGKYLALVPCLHSSPATMATRFCKYPGVWRAFLGTFQEENAKDIRNKGVSLIGKLFPRFVSLLHFAISGFNKGGSGQWTRTRFESGSCH